MFTIVNYTTKRTFGVNIGIELCIHVAGASSPCKVRHQQLFLVGWKLIQDFHHQVFINRTYIKIFP